MRQLPPLRRPISPQFGPWDMKDFIPDLQAGSVSEAKAERPGGEVAGGGEVLADDVGEGPCGCPDAHRRHGCQDGMKRVGLYQMASFRSLVAMRYRTAFRRPSGLGQARIRSRSAGWSRRGPRILSRAGWIWVSRLRIRFVAAVACWARGRHQAARHGQFGLLVLRELDFAQRVRHGPCCRAGAAKAGTLDPGRTSSPPSPARGT